jgi:lipopolysaccharide cholinephosphotransferase
MEDFSKYNGEGTVFRKAQLQMLDILTEVDKICRRHNITYWIDFGTLLGAVRHGGYVPWDEDIDISIMRKERKRLAKVLAQDLPSHLHIVKRQGYISVEQKTPTIGALPLFIDIFYYEKGNARIKTFVSFFYRRSERVVHHNWYNYKAKSAVEKIIAYAMYPFVCAMVCVARFIDLFSSGERLILSYENSIYVAFKQYYKSLIFPVSTASFEGREFLAPGHKDKYLTNVYGNYMQLPPEEEREIRMNNLLKRITQASS